MVTAPHLFDTLYKEIWTSFVCDGCFNRLFETELYERADEWIVLIGGDGPQTDHCFDLTGHGRSGTEQGIERSATSGCNFGRG